MGTVTLSRPVESRTEPSAVRSRVVGGIAKSSVDSFGRPSSGRVGKPGATIQVLSRRGPPPEGRTATRIISCSTAVSRTSTPPPMSIVHPPACSDTSTSLRAMRTHTSVMAGEGDLARMTEGCARLVCSKNMHEKKRCETKNIGYWERDRFLFNVHVTPEELSAPDSYSGSPTSYSGAEITEELCTPLQDAWGNRNEGPTGTFVASVTPRTITDYITDGVVNIPRIPTKGRVFFMKNGERETVEIGHVVVGSCHVCRSQRRGGQ
eukprot:scaffold10378_cov111-Isochrysis_galbana.AAC.1